MKNDWRDKLLTQADHVARMTCKLLRDDNSQNAQTLKAAAEVWLENYHQNKQAKHTP